MERQQVNPWSWQERFSFSHAWRVDEPRSLVFVAGQGAIGPDGTLVGSDDFTAQARQAFENLGAVLAQSGHGFEDVVKLTVYLTDVTRLADYSRIKASFIAGPQPASTAIGVSALALPGMMIEIDAFAVS